MVAKIKSGKSLKGALLYNEHKVAKGKAELLEAVGYPKDARQLTLNEKLFRLQDLASRNQRVTTNTVHISLNFGVGEKLSQDQLVAIGGRYLDGIGFAGQPYLIYQHFDAGHPHIHLLTTNIDRDGQRISLHNLGRTRSESTRKEIEQEFGLQRAEDAKVDEQLSIDQVRYGSVDSKRAIEQVVRSVCDRYRFTSLPEFNAILQQFNLEADRGSKTSVMNKQEGLRYWITNEKGERQGVPIKASALKGKPTMKLLRQRFMLNDKLRRSLKEQVREKIDRSLQRSATISDFQASLTKINIQAVIRRTDKGVIYGLTFIDNELKVVFNGSDLGKGYAAAAIAFKLKDPMTVIGPTLRDTVQQHDRMSTEYVSGTSSVLDILLAPVGDDPGTPAVLRHRKKKKRKLNL